MRTHLTGLAALLLAACAPMAVQGPAAPTTMHAPVGSPVARHGALHVANGRVVNAHGQPLTLRGMSLFWSQWAPHYYTRETVGWLASDWRVTAVRAAIGAEGNDSAVQHMDREIAKSATVSWGWGDAQLTPAGRLMRAHLRAAPAETGAQDD